LALFVVCPQIDGASTALDHALLKVAYQCASDPASLLVEADDERVKLPCVSTVMLDAANPTNRSVLLVEGDSADPIVSERFAHFRKRRGNVWKCFRCVLPESAYEQRRDGAEERVVGCIKISNSQVHDHPESGQ
jgi:hypothetical protein